MAFTGTPLFPMPGVPHSKTLVGNVQRERRDKARIKVLEKEEMGERKEGDEEKREVIVN